ncbi:hypothetical protein HIM_10668 [Hirsutella minnesotensis 3608]|uniref:Uncharacterized protein n=1 Tax=Hirsutella minnesotensis 3608 TaxID=1043627 RepID=A0A0F7ZJT5_9HYPO|nr:hypothetical protein HIM_10668 [Hirsutella minnesotensis 3608]
MARPRSEAFEPSCQATKLCFNIQRTGSCKWGARCKFSHDISHDGAAPSGASSGQFVRPVIKASQPRDGIYQEWRRLLHHGSPFSRPAANIVARFFQLARDMMKGDIGVSQEVIKLLVTEDGLSFIKDVAERHVQDASKCIPNTKFWENEVMPLFQLVTHPRVIDSAVLEQEVAAIFNYLSGVGGARMKTLFSYLARLFQAWPVEPDSRDDSKTAALELTLATLSKILDSNTSNIINQAFTDLVGIFATCLADVPPQTQAGFSRLQAAKYVDYMRLRLEIGSEITEWQAIPKGNVEREQFVLYREFPGQLSAEGPRHDNDHAQITKIAILPTYQEIMSLRREYLPTTDSSQWHISGIRGRLDREFRLLREDTVGQLRDTIRLAFEHLRRPDQGQSRSTREGVRTFTYDNAVPIDLEFYKYDGLEMTVRCEQIKAVQGLNTGQRKDWWMRSKRLQAGALVCVINAAGSVLFCVVANSTLRSEADDKRRKQRMKVLKEDESAGQPQSEMFTLSDDADFLFVKLHLVDSEKSLDEAMRWTCDLSSTSGRCLVEFPGVLLASFKHTLEALQQMYEKPNLPFSDLLAPAESGPSSETALNPPLYARKPGMYEKPNLPFSDLLAPAENGPSSETALNPPLYARKPGFSFDARCLSRNDTDFTIPAQNPLLPGELSSRSSLDPTQFAALLNTLQREMSLIQGPPGTGKSYTGEKIIKLLLSNKQRAELGPVLCVCYTNHALDQLLEHLLDDGINQIIRIGSGSNSERLQDLNLKAISRKNDRTKSERSNIYRVEVDREAVVTQISELLQELSVSSSWRSVKKYLSADFPSFHDTLFGEEEEGWTRVEYSQETVIDRWVSGGDRDSSRMRPVDTLQHSRLSTMNHRERVALHCEWQRSIRELITANIIKLHREYSQLTQKRARVGGDVELRCLQQADIVGVTTTGLARNLDLLRRLRCKVMLCEEAGEVLEAHILTALLPSLQHVILIGDHLQLRPQIQNYELQSSNPRGLQYSLDVSLFERLVQPMRPADTQMPFSVLDTQRRMHPDISKLVRATLYPNLLDSENVGQYPQVVGMKDRLFWLHHEHLEAAAANLDPLNKSHVNEYEVEMATALHLEAAAANLDPLNKSHINEYEVEMATALVSHLVRQGEYSQGDIAVITPYLGQLHRLRQRMECMFEICVNDRDAEDLETLEAGNALAPAPQRSLVQKSSLLKSIRVATVDNFQGEEAKVIIISLVRSNPQQKCGFLSTSNRINVLLSRAQHGMYIIGNATTCQNVSMLNVAIDVCAATNARVAVTSATHERTAWSPNRITVSAASNVAGNILPADTAAPKTATREPVVVPVPSHARFDAVTQSAARVVTNPAPLAQSSVAHPNAHIRSAPCLARRHATGFRVQNGVRTVCLAATSAPAAKALAAEAREAGRGPSICGEPCPSPKYCQQCGSDDIKSTCVDFVEMKDYGEVDLNQVPCIFPDCGHFLTVSSMDGQMGMSEHYEIDPDGLPTDLKGRLEPFSLSEDGIKACPTCRGSLRNISRYGRVVRRAMLDEATKKFMTWSNTQKNALTESLLGAQERLERMPVDITPPSETRAEKPKHKGGRHEQLRYVQKLVGRGRYDNMLLLWTRLNSYSKRVRAEEQPFHRVADLVLHANRQNTTQGRFSYDPSVIQMGAYLCAAALLLKCEILVLSDFLELQRGRSLGQVGLDLDFGDQKKACENLISLARTRKHPKEEVQGHIFAAHPPRAASNDDGQAGIDQAACERLKHEALEHLEKARAVMKESLSTRILEDEAKSVEAMLKDGVYEPVTADELRAVYAAMAVEFRGTGHWYTCTNGHPFTIGECGMPMEMARCPECGERIGGQNHNAVEGVQRATQIENLAVEVDNLRL